MEYGTPSLSFVCVLLQRSSVWHGRQPASATSAGIECASRPCVIFCRLLPVRYGGRRGLQSIVSITIPSLRHHGQERRINCWHGTIFPPNGLTRADIVENSETLDGISYVSLSDGGPVKCCREPDNCTYVNTIIIFSKSYGFLLYLLIYLCHFWITWICTKQRNGLVSCWSMTPAFKFSTKYDSRNCHLLSSMGRIFLISIDADALKTCKIKELCYCLSVGCKSGDYNCRK